MFLTHHLDHVLSRNQILEAVWSDKLNVTERVVDTHISNLRKKMGVLGKSIKPIHGAGYILSIPHAA